MKQIIIKQIIAFFLSLLYLLYSPVGYAQILEQQLQQLQSQANQGDAKAQFKLAIAYDTGNGLNQDITKAFYWYQKAAEQGHVSAMYNLAVCYDEGEGTNQNKQKALYWYQKSANESNTNAQNNLAVMYEEGDGIEKNQTQTIYWYTKAAKQSHAIAQENIAYYYNKRNFNLIEAYAWAVTSVKNGNIDAKKIRKTIWQKLSDTEKIEAKKLAEQFINLYSDTID